MIKSCRASDGCTQTELSRGTLFAELSVTSHAVHVVISPSCVRHWLWRRKTRHVHIGSPAAWLLCRNLPCFCDSVPVRPKQSKDFDNDGCFGKWSKPLRTGRSYTSTGCFCCWLVVTMVLADCYCMRWHCGDHCLGIGVLQTSHFTVG